MKMQPTEMSLTNGRRWLVLVCGCLWIGTVACLLAEESKSDGIRLNAIRLPDTPALRGPDLVDLDGDGLLDLVSGSYEGRIFFASQKKGGDSLEFADEIALQTDQGDVKIEHW